MAKNNVVGIGVNIPGANIEEVSIQSKVSLLDYDIAIIDPIISSFYEYSNDKYLGKPSLNDSDSFSLKEKIEYWRREILESVKAGKNIFIMLNSEQNVYIATGKKSYSGIGRNRQTTRLVTIASNYHIIPGGIQVTSSNGASMVLVGKDNVLAPYWMEMGEISEFRILLNGDGIRPLVQTKTGQKIVGGIIRYKNAGGNLFLLPYIDFERENYMYENEEDGKDYWTDEAVAFGKKFVSSLCSLSNAINTLSRLSAKPVWLTLDRYTLPKEDKIRNKIINIDELVKSLGKKNENKDWKI